jgi:(p)ppGpp synthase/HD superfamily hydrolase
MRVEQAIELASRFHEGAVDKAGRPYIGHILRVVDAVNTHEEKLAAAMHVKGTIRESITDRAQNDLASTYSK